eukprot:3993000-Pleurochrysis_carterae.AAC.1
MRRALTRLPHLPPRRPRARVPAAPFLARDPPPVLCSPDVLVAWPTLMLGARVSAESHSSST